MVGEQSFRSDFLLAMAKADNERCTQSRRFLVTFKSAFGMTAGACLVWWNCMERAMELGDGGLFPMYACTMSR